MPDMRTERQEWIEMIVAEAVAAPGTGAMTHINRNCVESEALWIGGFSPFARYWNGLSKRARTMFVNECSTRIERKRKEIAVTKRSQSMFDEALKGMG